MGFSVGADDYIVKPFSTAELLMRVRAVLRRSAPAASAAPEQSRKIAIQDIVLDLDSQSVVKGGETVSLTYTEFKILELLASHLTPEQLKTCVYHCELEMAGNRVMLCDDLYNPPERGEMVSFNVCFEDVASARAAYDAMVEAGAKVLVPAHEATFAAFVSSVVDPFGIRWGLMVER
jgi:uncharacterized glyoxalase superfamily protein PhnB